MDGRECVNESGRKGLFKEGCYLRTACVLLLLPSLHPSIPPTCQCHSSNVARTRRDSILFFNSFGSSAVQDQQMTRLVQPLLAEMAVSNGLRPTNRVQSLLLSFGSLGVGARIGLGTLGNVSMDE
jgi:hypothetical protein